MAGSLDRRGGRGGDRPSRPYPRTARVNSRLVQVLGAAVERASEDDERLGLLTVTAVTTEPDLRHATVFFASLPGQAGEALAEHRPALQAAIAREVRMKRTPQLRFAADPAVAAGERVEERLRQMQRREV
ncbi:MAG: ribosome-binding factor A [Actinomycetota bacterium]|nr:ribosome-binding factor A [Actinomycetota bacterium]